MAAAAAAATEAGAAPLVVLAGSVPGRVSLGGTSVPDAVSAGVVKAASCVDEGGAARGLGRAITSAGEARGACVGPAGGGATSAAAAPAPVVAGPLLAFRRLAAGGEK
jgi:hypothetical protein